MSARRPKRSTRVKALPHRKLSANKARGVRGGITVTKVTDVSSSPLFREALSDGKHVKID